MSSKLFRFRFDRNPRGQFAVLITHWFYFTNSHYAGERPYWVRIGQWRKSFGRRAGCPPPESSQ